jgi:F-type H+-transporting ATPase subunit delta
MRSNARARRDARALFHLCLTDGQLNEALARDIAHRLSESRHRNRLAVLESFRRWVELYLVQHTAKVESAVPLEPGLRQRLQTKLDRTYGPGLTTSFAKEPALLGGMRIKVGTDVYDGSIRAGLEAVQARL